MAAAILISGTASTNPPVTAEVDRLLSIYTNELGKVETQYEKAAVSTRDQYQDALRKLEQRFKDAGALDSLLRVKEERTRFATNKTLRAVNLQAAPAELTALQQQHMKLLDGVPMDRASKISNLAQRYTRSLKSLEETLTRQDRLDDAITVKQQREAAAARPEIQSATFLLYTNEPQAPTNAPAETRQAPVPDGAPAKKTAPAPTARKYTGSAANRISAQFRALVRAIEKEDKEAAAQIVDPTFQTEFGSRLVQQWTSHIFPPRLFEEMKAHLTTGDIKVAADEKSASMTPEATLPKRTIMLRPLRWVLVDGDWYVDPRPSFRRLDDQDQKHPKQN